MVVTDQADGHMGPSRNTHASSSEEERVALLEMSRQEVEVDGSEASSTKSVASWKKLWDTYDKPPLEQKLLFKVDAVILTFASVSLFSKMDSESSDP